MSQSEMALIPHEVENRIVQQRAQDGYINATEMCRAAGKQVADYGWLKTTRAYLHALGADMGIPITSVSAYQPKSHKEGRLRLRAASAG